MKNIAICSNAILCLYFYMHVGGCDKHMNVCGEQYDHFATVGWELQIRAVEP